MTDFQRFFEKFHAPYILVKRNPCGGVTRYGVNITDPADRQRCIDNGILLITLADPR